MKRHVAILLFLAGSLASALGADGADADFTRYSVILDRKPFGVPPVEGLNPDGTALVAPDSFATYVRLTALMQEEGGQVRVGFVDKKQKDKSYMLAVGEKADDYEVLEASVPGEVARIRKGTEEQWLSLKTPGAVTAPAGRAAAKPGVSARPSVRVPAIPMSGNQSTNMAARRQTRYAAIRRAEIEREKLAEDARKLGVFREPPEEADDDEDVIVPPPPAQAVQEDEEADEVVIPVIQPEADEEEDAADEDEVIREAEIQQHLQDYQKELITQGLPPLPIPLTAKTDAELVKANVLPPLPAGSDDDE
jgi:hypothetical protein